MSRRSVPRRARGFTLVELLVVMAVAAVLLMLAVPSFGTQIARNRVEGAATALATDLQYARSESVARNAQVGVIRGTGCYAVYVVGTTAATDCTSLGTGATEIKRVTLDSVTVAWNAGAANAAAFVEFDPVRGMASSATGADRSGSFTLGSSVGAWQLLVDVSPFGRVKTCSPSGSFKGYSQC